MTNTAARSAAAFLLMGLLACEIPTAPPRFQPTFVVDVDPVSLPVTSMAASTFISRDLANVDPDVAGRARGGAVVLRIDNPSAATGVLTIRVDGGGETVTSAVDAAATSVRIPLDVAEMRAFLTSALMIRATGTLCPADGCVQRPPPFPAVTLHPRLEVQLEIGGV